MKIALPDSSSRVERFLGFTLWIAAAIVGIYHLGLQLATIGLPPMGFWETTYVARANAWPDQYQWAHYIDGHDGYGPGYPSFVRPLLWAGLDVYAAHRLANLIAILAGAFLVWRLLRERCESGTALALTTIFYALNAGSYSVQARPDFLVLFAMTSMLALGNAVITGQLNFTRNFGVFFALLTLAAFFTKGYAGFTAASVLVVLAILVDWRRGVSLALLVTAIVSIGVITYAVFNPLYVMEVFEGQRVQAAASFDWLCYQLGDFAILSCGPLAVAGVAGLVGLVSKAERAPSPRRTPPSVRKFWLWQTMLALLSLLAGAGWHAGAYLTYFFHLLLVPLTVFAGGLMASATPFFRIGCYLAVLINLAVLMKTAPPWPTHDENWARLRQDILSEPGRVGVDYLMEPIAREKPGTILFGTGTTGYVLQEPFLIKKDTPMVRKARQATQDFNATFSQEVFGQNPVHTIYLDCVLTNGPGTGAQLWFVPRNGIPAFLGPEMNNYVVARRFIISPYYFATNVRRQDAAAAKTTIVKLIRKK